MTARYKRVEELGHGVAAVGQIGNAVLEGDAVAYRHDVDLLAEVDDHARVGVVRVEREQRLRNDGRALEVEERFAATEKHVETVGVELVVELVRRDEHELVLGRVAHFELANRVLHNRLDALDFHGELL